MSDNFILSCCSTVDLPYSYMESRHIPVLFYTYTGICGRHWLWADILTFVLGAAVTAYYTWKYARRGRGSSVFGAVVLAVITVCFGVFSLFPPAVGIFAIP